jgi:hypothetical protein
LNSRFSDSPAKTSFLSCLRFMAISLQFFPTVRYEKCQAHVFLSFGSACRKDDLNPKLAAISLALKRTNSKSKFSEG